MKTGIAMGMVWAVLAGLVHAQTPEQTPAMSPGAERSASSGGIFGVGGFGGDRPKDAKTEITATEMATFDNATSIAEFTGKVVVKDPQFNLFCDRLKVTLHKDRKGMQLVEAFGNVVIVQENTNEAGEKVRAIGRGGKAVFVPDSGDITLTVWPQVQHGINNQIATEEGTVMVLNRNGRSRTTGGSRTVIVDTGETPE
jgi:lipopolysaccharide transport protein LptA